MQWPLHHEIVLHEIIKNLISCHEKYYIINAIILTDGYHMEGKSVLEHHFISRMNTKEYKNRRKKKLLSRICKTL